MFKRLQALWPGKAARRRLALVGGAVGIIALAFCWGRWGALSEATAQQTSGVPGQLTRTLGNGDTGLVASIYNGISITREDLGEYLIARFGAERVDFLVNRRIMERVCQARGIQVTDAEVEAQLVEDLRGMRMPSLDSFVKTALKRHGKTLYEYKEDVIRPRLAMAKLVRPNIVVTEKDLQEGFEARFGEKVHCRMIVLPKEMSVRDRMALWEKVSKSEADFDKAAREQYLQALAYKGGDAPPIHKHFGDANIERVAFNLRPGEVSQLFEMQGDGTGVILKCIERIAADTTRRLEDERLALHREITEMKVAQEVPRVFQKLREEADPKVYFKNESGTDEMLARRIDPVLRAGVPMPPGMAAAPAQGAAPHGN